LGTPCFGQYRVKTAAVGCVLDGTQDPRFGLHRVTEAHMKRSNRFDEIDLAWSVFGGSRQCSKCRTGEPRIERRRGCGFQRNCRQTAGRELRFRGIRNSTAKVEQCRETIIGSIRLWVVKDTPFCSENALERFPSEIGDASHQTKLATDPCPDVFQGNKKRFSCTRTVDVRVDPRARGAVLGVERENGEHALSVARRFERARHNEGNARRSVSAAGEISPGLGRQEGLDGPGGRALLILPRACLQLRQRHAAAVYLGEAMNEPRQAEAKPARSTRDSERNDDRARTVHDGASARPGVD
jgi:hypothetical protein